MTDELDVSGASSTPEGVEGSPPQDGVVSASPPEGEEPAQTGSEEVLPFGKHPRWIKMNESNKAMKAQLSEAMAKVKEAEGAAATARWIKEDPKGFMAYLKSQLGEDKPAEPTEDPYAAFEPEVAERFRRYDKALEEAERQKKEAESRSKQTYEERVASNRTELDAEFDKMALEVGLIDAKGVADEEIMDVIAHATLAKLHGTARDPRMPTKAELKTAFDVVVKGFKKSGKLLAPKSAPPPPPSGSNRGTVPNGKTKRTDDERVADILSQLG